MRAVVKNEDGEIVSDTSGDPTTVASAVSGQLDTLVGTLPDSGSLTEPDTTQFVIVVTH